MADFPQFPIRSGYPGKWNFKPEYPDRYDAELWAANQHPVPSQNVPVSDAYYPGPVDLVATTQPGSDNEKKIDNLGVVRSVYDSRPPYAYDFTFTDLFGTLGGNIFGGFACPPGYVTVLRKLTLSLYGSKAFLLDAFGFVENQGVQPQLRLILNGGQQAQWVIPLSTNSPQNSPVAGFAGNFAPGALTGETEYELFLPLIQGTIVNIAVIGWTDTAGLSAMVTYSGQMILDDGRIVPLQIGNADPEPVRNM
ncbi:MAG: hypothetical protein KGJ13_05050 [Patescibacteria group bacterium]|nr:hypothetical protein [Patescibacteria group bacterium]